MTVDLHTLTGAFVLDAVSRAEQRAFERHLGECEPCATEVVELRETAARLGIAVAAPPPAYLRTEVLAAIHDVRQGGRVLAFRHPRRVAATLSAAAAAVLVVATTTLGLSVTQRTQPTERAEVRAAAVSSLLGAGDLHVSRQDTGHGRFTAVVSQDRDRLVFLADDVPPPPKGQVYQAWTVDGESRSAGLLAPDDGQIMLKLDDVAHADEFALTAEPAGGSSHPTTEPITTLALR